MTIIQEACKYAQRGWKVFPLTHDSKKPLPGSSGFKDATDDLEAICTWNDNCNLGIATGSTSGFWVLDIDVKNGANGIETMRGLLAKYKCSGFKTRVARTVSGGFHYFFKMPDYDLRLGAGLLPGIDIRANGGYIVAPPSIINGNSYSWLKEHDIADAPAWLYEELKGAKNKIKTGSKLNLQQGSRNDSLFRIACNYRNQGYQYEKILALITIDNQRCSPPLGMHEITTLVNSACKYEPAGLSDVDGDETFAANGRTPGAIALAMLYGEGNYIAVNGDLYKYIDGYYQKLDDGGELANISKLLGKCITNTKTMRYDYAKAACANDALNYVKNTFYIPVGLTNPVGINLRNGVLKPVYLSNGLGVEFQFFEHSPDEYFLYQADFVYRPEIGTRDFDEVFNNMLDPEPGRALLRNIASTFDMKTVRSKHTRALRALILSGEGLNGKDSLRTWCSLLFGEKAFSNVSLQVLKRADSSKEYQINDLAHSKINWASENSKVMIDSCQLIKQIVTGDPIMIEKKYKEPFSFEPEIVMMFNANDMPAFESLSEAIQTRYAIIPFPYVFKDNPNPGISYERLADPRLKHDAEFIKLSIMPGFLNALIREFKALLASGIDYSFQESIMNDIREDNNHFYSFLQDMRFVECDPDSGLLAKEIYDLYRDWCAQEGFIIKQGFGRDEYNHPHDVYDKILKNYRHIGSKLLKFFPKLKNKKTKTGRRYGLCIDQTDPNLGW